MSLPFSHRMPCIQNIGARDPQNCARTKLATWERRSSHSAGVGHPIIECVLRDISATGACISVEVPEVVPDYFFLKMEKLGEQMLPRCRVRWRFGNTLGVEYFRQE